jgi:hypothetical protein
MSVLISTTRWIRDDSSMTFTLVFDTLSEVEMWHAKRFSANSGGLCLSYLSQNHEHWET